MKTQPSTVCHWECLPLHVRAKQRANRPHFLPRIRESEVSSGQNSISDTEDQSITVCWAATMALQLQLPLQRFCNRPPSVQASLSFTRRPVCATSVSPTSPHRLGTGACPNGTSLAWHACPVLMLRLARAGVDTYVRVRGASLSHWGAHLCLHAGHMRCIHIHVVATLTSVCHTRGGCWMPGVCACIGTTACPPSPDPPPPPAAGVGVWN